MYVYQVDLSRCKILDKSNEEYVFPHCKRVDKSNEQWEIGRLIDLLSNLIL